MSDCAPAVLRGFFYALNYLRKIQEKYGTLLTQGASKLTTKDMRGKTMKTGDCAKPDFIEERTTELLVAAKRSGFFADAIADAKQIQEDEGYAWDCALAISCQYWCR